MNTILWLAGGLTAGTGILTLTVYGFDQPGGEVSASYSKLGWDALPVLVLPNAALFGIGLIVVGAALMIKANATVWKQTGGY